MGGELVEPPYFHSSFFIDVEPLRFARPLEKGTKCTTPPTATTQHHPLGGWGSNLWANDYSPLQSVSHQHTKKSVPRRKPTLSFAAGGELIEPPTDCHYFTMAFCTLLPTRTM